MHISCEQLWSLSVSGDVATVEATSDDVLGPALEFAAGQALHRRLDVDAVAHVRVWATRGKTGWRVVRWISVDDLRWVEVLERLLWLLAEQREAA